MSKHHSDSWGPPVSLAITIALVMGLLHAMSEPAPPPPPPPGPVPPRR